MIFRSPYADVEIPEISLPRFVLERAREFGEKPALIDGLSGRTITYTQLYKRVRHTAKSLAQRGYRKGDVFALYSPNVPEYAIAFHAITMIGGIVTPINPLYTAEELENQLNDSDAKCVITTSHFVEKVRQVKSRTAVREICTFDQARNSVPFVEMFESVMLPNEIPTNALINPREDLFALPYSSGTTGKPKGVMRTHYGFVANLCQLAVIDRLKTDDIFIGLAPMFHVYGMFMLLCHALRAGATVVTLPRFEIESFLQTIQNYRVTHVPIVPPIVLLLAQHPMVERYDLSSITDIYTGAAPQDADIAHRCANRLNCIVKQGYGMTEAGPLISMNPNRDDQRPVGLILPNTEVKIVDPETGAGLGAREQGEICVRGTHLMKGYLNRPEETAKMIDAEGWLHTGDVGYVDNQGMVYVVDRIKELIKVKAMQVAPAELESILLQNPAVADVAVIGTPDLEAGEVPKAFVVRRSEISEEVLMAYVAERVAPHKKLRHIEFIESIPKSSAGKILRRVLVERERAQITHPTI